MTTTKTSLVTLGSVLAVGGALVGLLAWRARPQMSLPEPVEARLAAVPEITVTQGMTLTPLLGRFGQPMVIAEATSAASTREDLLRHLRRFDDEVRAGVRESDLHEDTAALVILTSSTVDDLSVSTADLFAQDGTRRTDLASGEGAVSEVSALPTDTPAPVVGGDAQPQDVTLPER